MAVVTQPDRPAGRGHRLTPTPVKSAAVERGVRVLEPERLREIAPDLDALAPDLFVVVSYGKIVPASLLAIPRRGIALNVHPSLLPLYRGATPLQSVLRDGRTETGVTIIAMDAGMDTGDIVLQEPTPIAADETYDELHARLALVGAELLVRALDGVEHGTVTRTPQAGLAPQSEIDATSTRPLTKEDLVLAGPLSAVQLVDRIRSLSRTPGARTKVGFAGPAPAKILRAHVATDGPQIPERLRDPGLPLIRDGRIWLEATDGLVAVDELVLAGGKPMTAKEFEIGHKGLNGPENRLAFLRTAG